MQFITKSKLYLIVASCVLILSGASLIIWTDFMKSLICYVIGVALLIFGLVKVVSFLVKRRSNGEMFKYDFAIGLFLVLAGLLFVLKPDSISTILQTIICFSLLADAAVKLQFSLDAYHLGASNWWILFMLAVITGCMGMTCVLVDASEILLTLLGVALVVEGAQNIATVIYVSRMFKVDRTTDVVYYKTDLED